MLKEKTSYKEGLPVNILVANIKEYPIHFHDDIEVVYVLAGSLVLKNGYYTYTLRHGDIFILNDKEVHSYESTGEDNMVLLLQMDVSYFSNYYDGLRNCFFITDVNDGHDEGLEVLRHILVRMTMEVLQKGRNFEHKVIENAHNLISCFISDFQYFAMEEGKFVNESGKKGNKILAERLRRITDYMYENHSRKLTLGEIADREHLSIFYLSHVIKQATGLSFQDLLNFIRVEESEKLLLGTNKKIGAVSDECGFSAVRYYIKHFQSWFGMHPSEYRKKYTGKVISRETVANYEKHSPAAIEEFIKKQVKGVYDEYVSEGRPKPNIFNIDMTECMLERKQKYQFPEDIFKKEIMKVAARPYNLFKSLNEKILFSSKLCMISTSAASPQTINNLSILIYSYDEEFYEKLRGATGKENLIEQLKTYDSESEILIRCIGVSGNFKITRYKMTKQNVISACEEWARVTGTVNKRQALLNSWSTLPNIEAEEIIVSDTLSLRFTLRGFGAELILIDRN